MLPRRFSISSRTQRIALSGIALALALIIATLGKSPEPTAADGDVVAGRAGAQSPASEFNPAASQEEAVAHAVRWLEGQEGGRHRGHAIARHVGKTEADLRDRLDRDGVNIASGFYDLETAAVAIVRTIRHKPNDALVRRWLADDASQRRLALRRMFDRPIGLIVRRGDGVSDGRSAVAVLTKERDGDRAGYRLLTAYVEP